MNEHPILFSGPMVRAILSGEKTQTRRIVRKPRRLCKPRRLSQRSFDEAMMWAAKHKTPGVMHRGPCDGVDWKVAPPCLAGDRLWVRETLRDSANGWRYAADSMAITMSKTCLKYPAMISWAHHQEREYCPSIHMPRWASRITLEVTSVRVERLQEIGEDDAYAEGIMECDGLFDELDLYRRAKEMGETAVDPRVAFAQLWDTINAKRAPWSANPWVWVIGFMVAP